MAKLPGVIFNDTVLRTSSVVVSINTRLPGMRFRSPVVLTITVDSLSLTIPPAFVGIGIDFSTVSVVVSITMTLLSW